MKRLQKPLVILAALAVAGAMVGLTIASTAQTITISGQAALIQTLSQNSDALRDQVKDAGQKPVAPESDAVVGEAGAAGTDGLDGARGPRGLAGTDGLDGAAGVAGIDSTAIGATGDAGAAGTAGQDGTDGGQGATGPAGTDGAPGADGAAGAAGTSGEPPSSWTTTDRTGKTYTCTRTESFDATAPTYTCTEETTP